MVRNLALAVIACSLGGTAYADEKKEDRVVVKRRNDASDEDLRKQLLFVPEVGLGQAGAKSLCDLISATDKSGRLQKAPQALSVVPDVGPRLAVKTSPTMKYMPWRATLDAQLGKEAAERLDVLSNNLRDALRKSVPSGDKRPDANRVHSELRGGSEWRKPEAIPTILQLLQAENTPIRVLLVKMLSDIEGKAASVALAQRAVFDVSSEVRETAVSVLARRPAEEYQKTLVDGLRYPWPAAADHAAEALAALKNKEATPYLITMLKEPDPRLPIKENKTYYIRELVRMSHMSNCMVCHAPSLSKEDLVRGRVPVPGEDPPPLYYAHRTGTFVRADTTFLKQDFSLMQPVANAGKWPGNQRFDYLVRARPLNPAEIRSFQALEKSGKITADYPQKEAVLFALRAMTGRDEGSSYEGWAPLLKGIPKGDR